MIIDWFLGSQNWETQKNPKALTDYVAKSQKGVIISYNGLM